MSQYIAYHSTEKMGYEYKPIGPFSHYSGKPLSFLQSVVGGRVWVVTGKRDKKRSIYRLAATYTATEVHSEGDQFLVSGKPGVYFKPAIEIGDSEWFERLFLEQNRFSYGFNRIRDASIVKALQKILADYQRMHAA